MMSHYHPYHMVELSPWPIMGACGALLLTSGLVNWFHNYLFSLLLLGVVIIIFTMIQWWRDVIRESTFQGLHTSYVVFGLRWGMILFILSEVLFFFSFFWAFFHSSLAPTMDLGSYWPPVGVFVLNPFQVPLLNTAVLLASGVTVTWAHHSLMESNYNQGVQGLMMTVLLGLYFTLLQGMEYYESSFSISDSVYGTTFFVATGFHGLHVIIGSSFLMICLLRHFFFHFSKVHHFGFEASAWYWHFVDVVWLFLFISIYWWGS
uniref:Cytochrome c oxidase subunit 3 n=1 Tax=Oroperipatus sp. DVL-2011 TaxID=1035536 RepID=G1CDU5_9BILA|nr:cytochrome c oxidase subunit III [Oroperipatus sp. DVL-2011]AEK48377.1 cytochrome c oxidase subunit 3 [Oroperipatus sp. DVL-2011]